ncbi:MAG: DUF456 domain-containing protein [Treponema sp.]|nr:DUF456 domain-containing protein [Treponema sp.]
MENLSSMDILLFVGAALLFFVGIVGCIIPGLPGTPLCWGGLLCASFTSVCTVSWPVLIICAIVTAVVEVINNIVPAIFTRRAGGSKEAAWGSIIGTFVGLLGLGVGVFMGEFLGAFLGELVHDNKDIKHALIVAFWSFLGFITGVGLRLLTAFAFIAILFMGMHGDVPQPVFL